MHVIPFPNTKNFTSPTPHPSAPFAEESNRAPTIVPQAPTDNLTHYTEHELQFTAQQSGSTELEIKTVDGDLITLKMHTAWQVEIQSEATHSPTEQTQLTAQEQIEAYSIQYQVSGELDEDELQALDQVMKQLSVTAEHFFSGDLPTAITSLDNFQLDASEFTSLSLNMQRSVSYSMMESYKEISQIDPAAAPSYSGGLLGLSDFVNEMMQLMDEVNDHLERLLSPEVLVNSLMQQAIERDPRSNQLPELSKIEIETFLDQITQSWYAIQPDKDR